MVNLNPIQQFVAKECGLKGNVRPRNVHRLIERITTNTINAGSKQNPNYFYGPSKGKGYWLCGLEMKAYEAGLIKGKDQDSSFIYKAVKSGKINNIPKGEIRKAVQEGTRPIPKPSLAAKFLIKLCDAVVGPQKGVRF